MQKFHQLCTQMRVRIEIFICFVWFETSHLIGPRCYDTKFPREAGRQRQTQLLFKLYSGQHLYNNLDQYKPGSPVSFLL